MKKFLFAASATALAFSAFAAPIMAAEGTGTTTIGYEDALIPDPDNPTNPDWSVQIPKSFDFTKTSTTNSNMDVTLKENTTAGLATGKKVQIDVKSANKYNLVNASNTAKSELTYELTYGSVTNTDGQIGELTKAAKTITGTAKLTDNLNNTGIDGRYEDTLTYTIHSAV